MQPEPTNQNDSRNLGVPNRDSGRSLSAPQRDAAANIIRDRISSIYDTAPPNQPSTSTEPDANTPPTNVASDSAYARTHDADKSATNWEQYHSAWQNYYQQYYHRYYMHQLSNQKTYIDAQKAKEAAKKTFDEPVKNKMSIVGGASNSRRRLFQKVKTAAIGTTNNDRPIDTSEQEPSDTARNELLDKVRTRATSFRKSNHFMPLISAVVVGSLFLGLQYNRLIVAQVKAYVSPGGTTTQNIILDPTVDTKVGPEPRLIIPKINVDVPLVLGVQSLDNNTVQNALRDGVVHYPIPGANSYPGQTGNNVILGHSSNDVFDAGAFKFAFVLLERLEKGDTFYINYQGTRYTYAVTEKKVINPNQIDTLILDNSKPVTTLVTCTPIGTALQRLLVYADQVSPDPTKATEATSSADGENVNIPGNSPTLLERLFGN